jgi:penicillin-binding protein 1A
MREALVESLNLVSIRILRDLGTATAIDYMTRFGFEKAALPDNLTLALGTTQATPLQMVTGYATFANGGYKVTPYLIERIENSAGKVLFQAAPAVVCRECESAASSAAVLEAAAAPATDRGEAAPLTLPPLPPTPSPELIAARNADAPAGLQALAARSASASLLRPERIAPRVITPQNDYLMVDMMADVIRRGTGHGAMVLGRKDLAGKTGTTNQVRDTWFNGFNTSLVSTVWVGYDIEQPLGETEQGARTALPIWVHFMREALKGVPEKVRPMPPGIVQLHVSSRTGAIANASDPDAITEVFMITHLPAGVRAGSADSPTPPPPQQGTGEGIF